jgi:uncharacterized protein YggE
VIAHGEGIVSAKPDQVRIHIGVTTQGPTAQEASATNAKQTTAVIAQLKQQLNVAAADIRTMNYSLHPNYKHNRDGSNPTIAGYQANNTVEVRLNDVGLAGKAIDVATQSGANQIQGVVFSMRDEQKLRGEALAIAAAQARANAQAVGIRRRTPHGQDRSTPGRRARSSDERAGRNDEHGQGRCPVDARRSGSGASPCDGDYHR